MALIPQPQRRGIRPGFQLTEDIDAGFHEAVKGNQPNMALRYAEKIIERLNQQVQQLQIQVSNLKQTTHKAATPVKPAAPKKDEPTES